MKKIILILLLAGLLTSCNIQNKEVKNEVKKEIKISDSGVCNINETFEEYGSNYAYCWKNYIKYEVSLVDGKIQVTNLLEKAIKEYGLTDCILQTKQMPIYETYYYIKEEEYKTIETGKYEEYKTQNYICKQNGKDFFLKYDYERYNGALIK